MAAAEGAGPAGSRGPAEAEADGMGLTDLPGELLELILCCDVLGAADIGRVSCTCRRLREACQPRGKVWRERFRLRWAPPTVTARRSGGSCEGGRGVTGPLLGAGQARSAQAGPCWGCSAALGPLGLGGPGCAWGGESAPHITPSVSFFSGRLCKVHTEPMTGGTSWLSVVL